MRFRRSQPPQPERPAPATHVTIRIQDARGRGVSAVLSEDELEADGRWLLEAKACALAGLFWTKLASEPAR